MRKLILLSAFIFTAGVLMAQNFTEVQGAFPFNAFSIAPDSPVSAADLNHPLTEADRITVSPDGHLQANGKQIRIFGTNLSEFPRTHKEADTAAKNLAKQGYNCIRFHHTDADWTNCFIKTADNGKRVLNTKRLDDFDYFFAKLKENGIYSNINLLTGRTYTSKDGLLPEIDKVQDWKNRHSLGFWNDDGRKVQKQWAETLLTHVNPYTKLSYLEDPAVAIVEINNENGLLQAYLGDNLKEYNGEYWQDLEDQWNLWLNNKGYNYKSLAAKYNSSNSLGAKLISEESKWNLEKHQGAKATLTQENNTHKITVENNGLEGWHIQFNCAHLNMQENKIYTISFSAKASKPCEIDLGLMQAHDPWKNAGLSKKIKLSTSYQDYTYIVSGITTDSNLRLNFGNMGLSKGVSFYIKDVVLQEGGKVVQVKEGKKSAGQNKTVAMPHYTEYASMPTELKKLVTGFLWDTEDNYWKTMSDYVRKTLGSKSLLMGTIIGCSTPNIQSYFDIIDTHAYWYHPSFPNKDWDMSDYYVSNKTLTKADSDNTLTHCAKLRVYGKPFCCSEYDHPYPNQYIAEMYPMLAAYASFQDWDLLFTFCYTLPKTQNGQSEKITGYFDQGLTPVKSCAAPIASRIFREFKIKPAEKALYVPISINDEKSSLPQNHSWSIGDSSLYGMNKTLGLTSRIGVILTDNPQCSKLPANARLITKEMAAAAGTKQSRVFSDTKELYWDETSGLFIACNDSVMVTVADKGAVMPEFPNEWLASERLLPLTENTSFATVAAIRKDSYYAGFAASWNGNKGESLAQYGHKGNSAQLMTTTDKINLTTASSLGTGPALVSGVNGKLSYNGKNPVLFNYADLQGCPTGTAIKGNNFYLTPDCGSLWFTVKIK